MINQSIEPAGKGWFVGPWNSAVPVAVGFSDRGLNDPHTHDEMFELYLVAHGSSIAVVDGRTVALAAGDVLVVEPGEQHTFTASSDEYRHFVIQTPFIQGNKRESTRQMRAQNARSRTHDPENIRARPNGASALYRGRAVFAASGPWAMMVS